MDPTGGAGSLLTPGLVGLVGIVAVAVQIVKPFIKLRVRSQTLQDATLQFLAVALGVGLVAVQQGVSLGDGASVLKTLSLGVSVGLGAVGGYHVVAAAPPKAASDRPARVALAPDRHEDAALHPAA